MNGITHDTDMAGKDLLYAFYIAHWLSFHKEDKQLLATDEPELHLHPQLQENVLKAFAKYFPNKQIVIFTHSADFIDWSYLFY